MKLNKFIMMILVCIVSACSNEPTSTANTFEGTWTVSSVTQDAVTQPFWEGKKLTFSKKDPYSGVYFFSETLHPSVWKASGTWTTATLADGQLLRDDNIYVEFHFTNSNTMTLAMVLPETGVPCTEPGCPAVVVGNWHFTLER